MAQIDKLLETIVRRSADYAVLVSDQPVVLSVNGQEVKGATLENDRLENVLKEIVPQNLALGQNGEPTTFNYSSQHGRFRIIALRRPEIKWQVRVEPAPLPSYAAPTAQTVVAPTTESDVPFSAPRPVPQFSQPVPSTSEGQTNYLAVIGSIVLVLILAAGIVASPDTAGISGLLLIIFILVVGIGRIRKSRANHRLSNTAFRVRSVPQPNTSPVAHSPGIASAARVAQTLLQGELTLLTTLNERDKQVLSVALSPDGIWLATGLVDAQVNLWNLQSGRVERTLNHGGLAGAALKNLKASSHRSDLTENGVKALTFSPDGNTLATLSSRKLNLWRMPNGDINRALIPFMNLSRNYSLAFAPDGLALANGNMDGVVHLWDMRTLKRKFSKGHDWMIGDTPIFTSLFFGWLTQIAQRFTGQTPIAFSSDGRRIASGFYREVRVWDTQTGKLERSMEDGERNAMAWALPYLRMRSSSSSLQGATARILCIAFSPDGQIIATGSWSKDGANLLLWDVRNGRKRALDGHIDTVNAVAFSPDGQFLISGGKEGEVKLWNVASGELVRTLKAHRASVNAVALSFDGRTLATASDDRSIKLWLLQ